MPLPPNSPDLAHSDYYLFRSMAHFLDSRCLNNQVDVDVSVKEFIASNDKNRYQRVIKELAERYYLPTPPLGQDMTQGQFLSGV